MGESSDNHIGFNSRAAALLNNQMFSDVEIQVKDGNNHKTFLAHKLFLSMSSREFASMFYGKFESPKFIRIFDFKPHTVYLMLQFLYTNKLDLHSIEEARQLYSLSKKFGIRLLQELCIDFISKEELNVDTVLYMYDCALREKFVGLLSKSKSVISSRTKAVFDSPVFLKASADVVENILKLDYLTIESELDVLNAVVKWAHKNGAKDTLRESLMPFFPHIRFLTLRVEEFADFVRRYDILNGHESSLITRKLVQPNTLLQLPDYLCAITKSRNPHCEAETNKSLAISFNNRSNISCATKELPTVELVQLKTPLQQPDHLYASTKSGITPCEAETNKSLAISSNNRKSLPKKVKNYPPKQSFNFPLQESQKLFSTAFNGDVKSILSLRLLKGTIFIHSFVLKIDQQSNDEETFDVFLNISILNRNSSKSQTYDDMKVKDGVIVLSFDQPLKVIENNPMQIEVIIEDLKLNRCSIVKNTTFELNWGSNVVANMMLSSNQMSESGEYFFLISRLIYSPA